MNVLARVRHLAEWFVTVICQSALRRSPRLMVPFIGDTLGWLFRCLRIRYRVAFQNLFLSLPVLPTKKILARNYRHLGRTFASSLVLSSYETDVTLNLPDRFFDDISRGSVLLTGHLGHWELLGKILVRNGVRLAVVVRRQSNPRIDRLINNERRKCGMQVVYDSDLWEMVRYLRRGFAVGLLADQDFGQNTVPIRFFGRDCYSPKGLEFFSRFEVPMFYCSAVFEAGRWKITAEKSRMPASAQAQAYADWLEGMIRRYPDQWLWQHRRWKASVKTLATQWNPALL
jgi:KDO2-lipid IV(A) lauroyltransferase